MIVAALLVGAFYVFAGVVALRMTRLGSLMDGFLEALDGTKTDPKEKTKTLVLTIGAYATAARARKHGPCILRDRRPDPGWLSRLGAEEPRAG
jgi:hypothetical protein